MAEKVVRVCDIDGSPAAHTVRIQDGRSSWTKDLCEEHFAELLRGARRPRPGRRTASANRPASRKGVSPRRTRGNKARARKRATAKRRRGRTANVPAEVKKYRDKGMSYREIGDALTSRGIMPPRAKKWNPVVIGRMLKREAA
jgi:Recombinase